MTASGAGLGGGGAYAVDIKHWTYARVTAGDTIDRWSIVYDGAMVITRDSELEARQMARVYGWTVERVYEEGEG